MNTGQIIFIALIIGVIIFGKWANKEKKRDEAVKAARWAELERKRIEREAATRAAYEERMRVYKIEYDEYLKKLDDKRLPIGGQPLSFDSWRGFFGKH